MITRSTYLITTPIFYVNAAPHIGHLYSALLADASARWAKLKNPAISLLFSSGTDEHGLKIQRTAADAGKSPDDLCSENSSKFASLFKAAGICNTHFIRTTQSDHIRAVQHAWKILKQRGFIQKDKYAGWYSVPDEAFLPETQTEKRLLPDGGFTVHSTESGHQVEWLEEENYHFKLSHFQSQIRSWISTNPIKPAIFNQQVLQWLDERQLPDLSVSRSTQRLKWAIPVPDDDEQRIYVWLDALINYLTVCGYPDESRLREWWPADVQVIGKDILKFHAIYWPAFLFGLDLEPPRQMVCHSHWVVDHQKMSKSLKNVVDPFDRLERYSVDGLRYFLLREGVPHSDSNWSDEKIIGYLNAELANTIGNLLARCTSLTVNRALTFPVKPETISLEEISGTSAVDFYMLLGNLASDVQRHYDEFNFYKGIDCIMAALRDANALFQNAAPWNLAKSGSSDDKVKLNHILYLSLECLRISALLLSPIVPELSQNILTKISASTDDVFELSKGDVSLCDEPVILFKRIEKPVAELKKKSKPTIK